MYFSGGRSFYHPSPRAINPWAAKALPMALFVTYTPSVLKFLLSLRSTLEPSITSGWNFWMESIFDAYSSANDASYWEAFLPKRFHKADGWPIAVLNERHQIYHSFLWHDRGPCDHRPLDYFGHIDIPYRVRCVQDCDHTILRAGATWLFLFLRGAVS